MNWATTERDRQYMLRRLVVAALPAVAQRHASGVSVATLGIMYGCDSDWLHQQLVQAGHVDPEVTPAPPRQMPGPLEGIPMPGRKAWP
ncbi:hypothetical protein [Kitasatospora sp. NPDC088548]|uniref:hypothetical protein n=1 Tax=Kitasatospora sp. NPDC088548 TaxID=3364075 RepID=UPI00381881B8